MPTAGSSCAGTLARALLVELLPAFRARGAGAALGALELPGWADLA